MKHRRKKPRTTSRSIGTFPNGNPSWWNILFHSRPRRRSDRRTCHRVKQGTDPDILVWELGNHKPTIHYW